MKINFNSVISTLGKDKVGQIIGAALTEHKTAQALGKDFFGVINDQIQAGLTNLHMPDIEHYLRDLTEPSSISQVFMPSVKVAIISWILQELRLHPQLTRYAKIGQKLGTNAAIGAALAGLVMHATIFSSPSARSMHTNEKAMYNRVVRDANRPTGYSETWMYAQ